MTEAELRAVALDYAVRLSQMSCHQINPGMLTDEVLASAVKIFSWLQTGPAELVLVVSPPVPQP
jgi:hypothetical protein